MSQVRKTSLTIEESMKKLRQSLQSLEKICVQKENDVKARQQDLFGAPAPAKTPNNVVQLDLGKIQEKLDKTISSVEHLLEEGA